MNRLFFLAVTLLLLTACASMRAQTMSISTTSATPGDGQTVAFKGDPLALEGSAIKVGDTLPSAMVTGNDLKPVNLADLKGKVRIISVVPSIDPPVCEEQTHELSEKTGGVDKEVQLMVPVTFAEVNGERWSWCESRWQRLLFKKSTKVAGF